MYSPLGNHDSGLSPVKVVLSEVFPTNQATESKLPPTTIAKCLFKRLKISAPGRVWGRAAWQAGWPSFPQSPGSRPGLVCPQSPGSRPGLVCPQSPGSRPGLVCPQSPGSRPGIVCPQSPGSRPGLVCEKSPGSRPGLVCEVFTGLRPGSRCLWPGAGAYACVRILPPRGGA